jgi:hypothetical protein
MIGSGGLLGGNGRPRDEVFVPLRFEKSGLAGPVPNCELPKAEEGGGMPLGVNEGSARFEEGGGPAGVVEGILRNDLERWSGVEGGSALNMVK